MESLMIVMPRIGEQLLKTHFKFCCNVVEKTGIDLYIFTSRRVHNIVSSREAVLINHDCKFRAYKYCGKYFLLAKTLKGIDIPESDLFQFLVSTVHVPSTIDISTIDEIFDGLSEQMIVIKRRANSSIPHPYVKSSQFSLGTECLTAIGSALLVTHAHFADDIQHGLRVVVNAFGDKSVFNRITSTAPVVIYDNMTLRVYDGMYFFTSATLSSFDLDLIALRDYLLVRTKFKSDTVLSVDHILVDGSPSCALSFSKN